MLVNNISDYKQIFVVENNSKREVSRSRFTAFVFIFSKYSLKNKPIVSICFKILFESRFKKKIEPAWAISIHICDLTVTNKILLNV